MSYYAAPFIQGTADLEDSSGRICNCLTLFFACLCLPQVFPDFSPVGGEPMSSIERAHLVEGLQILQSTKARARCSHDFPLKPRPLPFRCPRQPRQRGQPGLHVAHHGLQRPNPAQQRQELPTPPDLLRHPPGLRGSFPEGHPQLGPRI